MRPAYKAHTEPYTASTLTDIMILFKYNERYTH